MNEAYFGKNCPKGMVQVEFVGCSPSKRCSDYGWKPTDRAFIEVYVDGERFRIEVGTYHDGKAERRGLKIFTPLGVEHDQISINTLSLFFADNS